MKYFLTNLQWLVYMTQLKDIKDQQDNLDTEHPERAKKNQGNFNTSGLWLWLKDISKVNKINLFKFIIIIIIQAPFYTTTLFVIWLTEATLLSDF